MADELNKFETFKTLNDYEQNLKSAEKIKKDLDADIQTLNDALSKNITSFTFKGKKYTPSSLRDLVVTLEGNKEQAQNNVEIANNRFKEAKNDNTRALKAVDSKLKQAEKNLELAKFQFQQGSIDETARSQAFAEVEKVLADKKRITENKELAFVAAGAPGSPATYAFQSDIGAPTQVAATKPQPLTREQRGEIAQPMVVAGTKTTTEETKPDVSTTGVVTTTPVIDVAKQKTFVTEQLAARGLENTPANREMLRKEYKTTAATGITEQPAAISTAWETTFREQFPAKTWLLDLDRTKYPQLFETLNKAVAQKYSNERFAEEVSATDFYKELSTSKQLKTIQSLVGTLGFQGTDFLKFVSDSINFGYQGDILKQKVYSEVFKKDESGNYVNPTALARTQKSAEYISTQNIAKAFFNRNPADSDIEKVLTGQMLTSDYERQQREFAKTRYGHLSNLLDQGMTLESIASAYQTTASRLLERDINDIDMSTGAFEQAVSFGEEGKKRLMTNSEWEKLLRSDPQYGWERTSNAKDEARALSANIAQAFGKII
jgi:exonuclease VII small subunit